MPFRPFGKKFSPKKPGVRKAASISTLDRDAIQRELNPNDAVHKIKINLDGNKIVFDGNEWVSETGSSGVTQKELHHVKRTNEKLTEENNLLKLKLEILLDMLTKSTAEQHLQGKEIDELKGMIRNRSQTAGR